MKGLRLNSCQLITMNIDRMKVEIFYPNAAMVIFLRRLLKSFRLKCNLIGLWIRLYIAKRESLSSVLEDICTKPRR